MYTIAIVLHATCAVAAFVLGFVLIFQSNLLRQLQLARALVVLLILNGSVSRHRDTLASDESTDH